LGLHFAAEVRDWRSPGFLHERAVGGNGDGLTVFEGQDAETKGERAYRSDLNFGFLACDLKRRVAERLLEREEHGRGGYGQLLEKVAAFEVLILICRMHGVPAG
jgi:hypothetical protein